MGPGFSHGYAGLLVFLRVVSTCVALHNTRTNQKKAETDSLLGTYTYLYIILVHIKTRYISCTTMTRTCSPRSWCKETLKLQPSQRGDEWRGSLANAQAQSSTYSFTRSHYEGPDFRSRRRHRCLRFCILQIIGQRFQLDSMQSQFLWDMSDMAKAPRQVVRAKENKENIMEELHTGAWHTELVRECTQGSLVPLSQFAKDLNKLQEYLSGH